MPAANAPAAILVTPDGKRIRLNPVPAAGQAALETLARVREEAEKEIERLIALLDATDPDPDLELVGDELDDNLPDDEDSGDREPNVDDEDGGDDELSMGWQNEGPQFRMSNGAGSNSGEEEEPSLGSFNRMFNQTKSWDTRGFNIVTDGEVDDCDREDDDPRERTEQALA